MRKSITKKSGIILLLILLFTTLVSCGRVDKETVISSDVSEDIKVEEKMEENKLKSTIEEGNKYLSEGKFTDAKVAYEKAISMAKDNKDLYLQIKNKYIEANRLDDAYYIIRLAINNNTDVDNMKQILNDIQSKFEIITFSPIVYQEDNYELPTKVSTLINNEEIPITINWNGALANTSTPGEFNFQGFNEQYGKTFNLNLTVKPNIFDKEIGSIKSIYKSNGKTYIDIDLAEFFIDKEALDAALADGIDLPTRDDGSPYVLNRYYIRNNSPSIKTYELSDNTSFTLCECDKIFFGYDREPGNLSNTEFPVTLEEFEYYINKESSSYFSRTTLCWINIKNGIVYSIDKQYTP